MLTTALGAFAFTLIAIGTAGLLLNELVADWGREATLVFAAANVLGLAALALGAWRDRRSASTAP